MEPYTVPPLLPAGPDLRLPLNLPVKSCFLRSQHILGGFPILITAKASMSYWESSGVFLTRAPLYLILSCTSACLSTHHHPGPNLTISHLHFPL